MTLTLEPTDSARIKWACRRGMLELDLILLPFFEQYFEGLPLAQKQAFIRLLDYPDPDIFNWLMAYTKTPVTELASIIELIRNANG